MNQFVCLDWRAMGCAMNVQLETAADGYALLKRVPTQVEAYEAALSRFRPDSELMRFNARAGEWVQVSDVLFTLIRTAKHAARLTEGHFNPLMLPAMQANGYNRSFAELDAPVTSAPAPAADWHHIDLRIEAREARIPAGSGLDLGGIAKGWAAARIADELSAYGACLVNFGGDLVGRGAPHDLPGWEVSITDPFDGSALMSFWLKDACLFTSGLDYRRWQAADGTERHHIIQPETGNSAETDVLTVSIYHDQATTAEAYTKAVILRGAEAGLYWLQQQWNSAGLVVRKDGSVLATPEMWSLKAERVSQ